MLKIKISVDSLDKIQNYIDFVERIYDAQNDMGLQSFLKRKVLEAAKMITDKELVGGTSNDEEIELYKNSHHIEDYKKGFILYNDAKISADKYNTLPFDTSGYPDGEFSIALAFEYGVGVVGQGTYEEGYFKSWDYNNVTLSKSKHRQGDEWYLPASVYGESGYLYSGYEGFEIYRKIAIFCEASLNEWAYEYFIGGVSND